jgi:hypothetical protein
LGCYLITTIGGTGGLRNGWLAYLVNYIATSKQNK